ncbi:hypothetical protein [Pseudodesulfovibrio indicus]|uniref:PilZ domain-containing protein n=1 Tax=Pseudodesulfovibrio indicus TaxID=1716143 RepID=A0A126QNJ8_9BACT|nr:hypothetical protein [Pseudodesulfovibrio indicus]AMK11474.1 hypothetical protein AWY79_10285 [Pseudodesulfovibrio indicus]TDT89873.1 hypothetical protein EDC59_103171 [Pseudodesulfovibrio indicus]
MDFQQLVNSLREQLSLLADLLAPGANPDLLRYAAAGVLGVLALLLLLLGLRLLRRPKRNSPSTRTSIPRTLQERGVVLDVLAGPDDEVVSVRCVITSAKSGKIKCEIIERLDVIRTRPGSDLVCVFAPMKTRDGRINSFTATLVESDRQGRNPERLVLAGPTDYALIPRRKHQRKRVADQQFMRVKLWAAAPETAEVAFEDAAPDIAVNSFSTNSPDQGANAVINISDGGIGLSVLNRLVPETCAPETPVVLNLFMFNFKEKTFRPFWYAGAVRSMEEGRPGFTRLGIEFTATAVSDRESGRLNWINL